MQLQLQQQNAELLHAHQAQTFQTSDFYPSTCEIDTKKYDNMQLQLEQDQITPSYCCDPRRLHYFQFSKYQCCNLVLNELGRAALPTCCQHLFQKSINKFSYRLSAIADCCHLHQATAHKVYACCLKFVMDRKEGWYDRAKRYFLGDLPDCCKKWFK